MIKIYTKGGDRGKTSLFGGKRVPKNHQRVEAYGQVDELGAHLGHFRELLKSHHGALFDDLEVILKIIQNELFIVGAELATEDPKGFPNGLTQESALRLERHIDEQTIHLAPLTHFILPSQDICSSYAHIVRTVCRRAERAIVAFDAPKDLLIYINRLSDWFFVTSRTIMARLGKTEELWKGLGNDP